jgi:hypothetical protein
LIARAVVADLDADGSPEVRVYVRSAGSGSYGALFAYDANGRKSLSQIHLPPVSDFAQAAHGHRGHDDFTLVEGTLVRRFLIYKATKTNAAPSGGVRQMQCELQRGDPGCGEKHEPKRIPDALSERRTSPHVHATQFEEHGGHDLQVARSLR